MQGFWGKRTPLCGRNWADFDPSDRVVDQMAELLALLVADDRSEVLDLDQPLADKHHLGDVGDTGDPGIADQLRIESQQPCGSSGYRLEVVFHSSRQRVPSRSPTAST